MQYKRLSKNHAHVDIYFALFIIPVFFFFFNKFCQSTRNNSKRYINYILIRKYREIKHYVGCFVTWKILLLYYVHKLIKEMDKMPSWHFTAGLKNN